MHYWWSSCSGWRLQLSCYTKIQVPPPTPAFTSEKSLYILPEVSRTVVLIPDWLAGVLISIANSSIQSQLISRTHNILAEGCPTLAPSYVMKEQFASTRTAILGGRSGLTPLSVSRGLLLLIFFPTRCKDKKISTVVVTTAVDGMVCVWTEPVCSLCECWEQWCVMVCIL